MNLLTKFLPVALIVIFSPFMPAMSGATGPLSGWMEGFSNALFYQHNGFRIREMMQRQAQDLRDRQDVNTPAAFFDVGEDDEELEFELQLQLESTSEEEEEKEENDSQNIMHKTRMCDFILKKKKCYKGGNCPCAHDSSELRPNPYYKTKLCKNHGKYKRCPKGKYCSYAHGRGELREPNGSSRE